MLLHIFQIQSYLLLHDYLDIILLGIFCLFQQFVFVTELDGSRVSNARANIQHMHLFWYPIINIVTYLRTGTNKTHISNEHIDELWQFIKFIFTDKTPCTSNSFVLSTNGNKTPLVRTNPHRAELKDTEILVVPPNTYLPIKYRPL